MKAYWWGPSDNIRNFGDGITPLLLKKFSGIDAEWSPLATSEIVVSGSVLHHIPPGWSGIIVGTGLIRADLLPSDLSKASVLAVRGPLTAQAARLGNVTLGDPGLLANELVPHVSKKYDLGIITHWSDNALAYDPRFTQYHPKIINPADPPIKVIREIGECRKIVTSSLHGMIVADAFGVPRRFETVPLFDLDTLFKFNDYSESIGLPLEIGKLQSPVRGKVQARAHEIYDVLQSLRK